MARGGRNNRVERDPLEIAIGSPMLGPLPSSMVSPLLPLPVTLSEIEDNRQFSFDTDRMATVSGSPARTIAPRPHSGLGALPVHRLGVDQPVHVVRCVRRKQRREVLFAKRRTRKGSGARRRRNQFSNTHCR